MTRKQRKRRNRILVTIAGYLLYIFVGFQGISSFIIALLLYLFIGKDVLRKAYKNIGHGQIFDENFLMTVATIGAFGCQEFSEAIAVMLFYQIGELFQSIALGKSRQSIQALLELKVEEVLVLVGDSFEEKDIEDVQVGDILLVKAGQKIGLDGILKKGTACINMAALTGESLPEIVSVGQTIMSGTLNLNSTIEIEVTKQYEDSTIAKIVEMVENATEKKAKAESFITKFARYYTPIVVLSALLLVLVPTLVVGDIMQWVHRACVFLVVSCPCALVISVPLTFFGGIGKASRNGILVKGSNYLEALAKVSDVCFDKTGTLTKGEFVVSEVNSKIMEVNEMKKYMALLEMNSNHPISNAIVNSYQGKLNQEECSHYQEIAGQGMKAIVCNQEVLVGNKELMESNDITVCDVPGTVVYLSVDHCYIGYVRVSDEIKESSKEFIEYLTKNNIHSHMFTGDSHEVASEVAKQLEIETYHAKLLPGDKVIEAEKCLTNKKGTVVFIGDGINDAPVLSRVDVGISMGQIGSDVAIEASDLVIMDDDLSKVLQAIDIAKRTMMIVKQNIIFALTIKIGVLILSSFGIVGMWAAVFGDVGVTILAIMNARRV